MADDDSAAWRGRVIDERYQVEEVLGRGGMGVVLRARHRFTGATVALKVLREDFAQDLDLQRRFLAEARAPNAIAHPGVAQVLDAGRDAAGELYLAMELLVGESLRGPIGRGALAASDVRRIGLELSDALGAAHARGFIHRDLKPENVFLVAPTATVKLLDFGIAKVLRPDVGTVARTAAGVVMGTPAYMAPEQLKDARGVDARADLWALGVMLYEMLAGRLPFVGKTFEELFIAVANRDPQPISSVLPAAPPALDAFFARSLARDPQSRFASTTELASALAALPLVSLARPPGRATPRPPESVLASGFASAATPGLAATEMGTAPPRAALRPAPSTGPVSMLTPLPHATPSPVQPMHTPPPRGPAPRASRHGPVYLGGAVVVALAAVGIAYVVTAHERLAPRDAAPASAESDAAVTVAVSPTVRVDAAVTPVPVPGAPIDAAVAPAPPAARDAGVTIARDAGVASAPNPPAPTRTTAEVCDAGCARLAKCGIGNPQCSHRCTTRPDIEGCMSEASTCNRAAVCGFMIVCGAAPSGKETCNKASALQGLCRPSDPGCACRVAQAMAPSHALALALYDGCAIAAAAACRGDAACITAACAGPRATCLAQ